MDIEKCLRDKHVKVIIPDKEGKPIYENCHIVAESARELAQTITPLIVEEIKRELEELGIPQTYREAVPYNPSANVESTMTVTHNGRIFKDDDWQKFFERYRVKR